MPSLRDFAAVTGAYWTFTLTDGALRMLVLLHLHGLGYAPLEIASLFLAYELVGVLTNLLGGWLGARHGLRSTLLAGLGMQVVACGLLAARAGALSLGVLLLAQVLAGVAKDLTKMSSKSWSKLVVPPGEATRLLRLVALLTGSKNALKGAGFFLGGLLLATLGFRGACLSMAGALVLALLACALLLAPAAGRAAGRTGFAALLSRDARLNWLSAARLFLFGSRDAWFVLALPIFLSSVLGWSHAGVGAFLAAWVIGYGVAQAAAPRWAGARAAGHARHPPDARSLGLWTAALLAPLAALTAGLLGGIPPLPLLVLGLAAFGVLFATGSAVHSYLVVHYAGSERVALDVGFYYAANASGRLLGTLLSGTLFQAAGAGLAGLLACLAGSLVLVAVSAGLCLPLRAAERRGEHVPAATTSRARARALPPGT